MTAGGVLIGNDGDTPPQGSRDEPLSVHQKCWAKLAEAGECNGIPAFRPVMRPRFYNWQRMAAQPSAGMHTDVGVLRSSQSQACPAWATETSKDSVPSHNDRGAHANRAGRIVKAGLRPRPPVAHILHPPKLSATLSIPKKPLSALTTTPLPQSKAQEARPE